MTRLIDADHLKWNVGGIKCGTLTVHYLNWIIDNEEPTVEAIPIEFIEKEAEKMRNSENPADIINSVILTMLIKKWREKQNERTI